MPISENDVFTVKLDTTKIMKFGQSAHNYTTAVFLDGDRAFATTIKLPVEQVYEIVLAEDKLNKFRFMKIISAIGLTIGTCYINVELFDRIEEFDDEMVVWYSKSATIMLSKVDGCPTSSEIQMEQLKFNLIKVDMDGEK